MSQAMLHVEPLAAAEKIDRARAAGSASSSIHNISWQERCFSVITGGALARLGLRHGGLSGGLTAGLGGGLVYRGVTGHCFLYQALRINTAAPHGTQASLTAGQGIRVEKSLTVNRSPEDLYKFWRNFENLPLCMQHLQSVRVVDSQRSHWLVNGPLGTQVEWDAEIINDVPGEIIAWRSLDNADVDCAGSVRFRRAAGYRGTEVDVVLRYSPPGGAVAARFAAIFGQDPESLIQEDLRRFKQFIEAGEIATVSGQSVGCCH